MGRIEHLALSIFYLLLLAAAVGPVRAATTRVPGIDIASGEINETVLFAAPGAINFNVSSATTLIFTNSVDSTVTFVGVTAITNRSRTVHVLVKGDGVKSLAWAGAVIDFTDPPPNPPPAGWTRFTFQIFAGSVVAYVQRSADNVAVVDSISALLARNPASFPTNVFVLGRTLRGDGGDGPLYWVGGDTTATNKGTIHAPWFAGSPAGRWRRPDSRVISAKWFGAVGNGITADTASLQAVFDFASANPRSIHIPAGIYNITETLSISNLLGLRLYGDGISNTTIRVASTIAGPAIKLWNMQSYTLEDFRLDCQKLALDGILVDTDLNPPSSGGEFNHVGVIGAVNNGIQLASSLTDNFQVDFTTLRQCFLSQSATNLVIKSSNALQITDYGGLYFGFGTNLPMHNIAILNGGMTCYETGFGTSTNYDIYVGTGAGLKVFGGYSESQSILKTEFLATDPMPISIIGFQHNAFNTNGNPTILWDRAGTFTLIGSKLSGNIYVGYATNIIQFGNIFSSAPTNGWIGSSDAFSRISGTDRINNWGFGTPTPYHKLDVLGSVRLQSTNRLLFRGTGSADGDVNLFGGGPNLLQSTNTITAPVFTPDQENIFQTGITNDVTAPALGLGNNKMVSLKSNTGSYTNGGFFDYDSLNRFRLGVNNSTHFYLSNSLVSIPATVDFAVTNVAPGQALRTDSQQRVKAMAFGAGFTWDGITLNMATNSSGSSSNAYAIVMQDGVPLTVRTNLNVVGPVISAVDNAPSNRTDLSFNFRFNPTTGFIPYLSNALTHGDSPLKRDDAFTVSVNYRAANESSPTLAFLKQGRSGSATNTPVAGTPLGIIKQGGWNGTSDASYEAISWHTSEDWTQTANGLTTVFRTVPSGTISPVTALTLNANGSFTPFASAAPTTSSAGALAFDNNVLGAGRGSLQMHDGTSNTVVVAYTANDPPAIGDTLVFDGSKWTNAPVSTLLSPISYLSITGSGADFTPAAENVYEKLTFGGGDLELALTAGTWAVTATMNEASNNSASWYVKLRNVTDAVDIANSERIEGYTSGHRQVMIQRIITVSSTKTIEAWTAFDDPVYVGITVLSTKCDMQAIKLN